MHYDVCSPSAIFEKRPQKWQSRAYWFLWCSAMLLGSLSADSDMDLSADWAPDKSKF